VRSARSIEVVDSHTEGMPTRVVTGGVDVLPGATMLERRAAFEADHDHLRTLLMYEPRGHAAMSGAILQPPTRPDADAAVLFIEVSGCLAMCGHGTIGVATVLVETGRVPVVEPVTTVRLEVPAGLVTAEVEVVGGRARAVTITNVASFVHATDVALDVEGIGEVVVDVAYGGNFYALVPADRLGVGLAADDEAELVRRGMAVVRAADAAVAPVHPEDARIRGIEHVVVTAPGDPGGSGGDPAGARVDGRSATVIHPGWIDRSPCGTGTSARMALLHHRGELALGAPYVHASFIGSRFLGRLVAATEVAGRAAVVPTIRGRAWISGTGTLVLDPEDPFPAGFLPSLGRAPHPDDPPGGARARAADGAGGGA
jgi:proline racemase